MEFGIVFPPYIHAWKDAQIAEDNGFTRAWFYDSQMLYSEIYICMGLVAEHTKNLTLGTYVAVPSNRIAPVSAQAIGTLNQMAPGRVVFGIGVGFTARHTMGLPPCKLAHMEEHIEQVRSLLGGGEALFKDGKRERWVRFLHEGKGYVNHSDPVPIHVASNGPKSLELTGRVGDGWITLVQPADSLRYALEKIRAGADKAGRTLPDSFHTSALTTACVTKNGESVTSDRVIRRVGPFCMFNLHAFWENSFCKTGATETEDVPRDLAELYNDYEENLLSKIDVPEDRVYQKVHGSHLVYLRPGEENYFNESLIKMSSLTGPAGEIIERIKAMEEAGLDSIAIQVVENDNGREMIEEFSREVIAKY